MMKPWHKLERSCAYVGHKLLRVARFSYYVRAGVVLRYPLCCVLHYAWDVSDPKHRSKGAAGGPAKKRGVIFVRMRKDGVHKKTYVPCGYHQGRHPNWSPWSGPSIRQLQLFSTKETKQ